MKINLFNILAMTSLISSALFGSEISYEKFQKLIDDTALFPYRALTFSSNVNEVEKAFDSLSAADKEAYVSASKADAELREIDPALLWKYVMQSYEEGTYKGKVCRSRESEKDSPKKTIITDVILPLFYEKCGLRGAYSGYYIQHIFLNGSNIAPDSDVDRAPWFYYDGRKYLPDMFKIWYECWKCEIKRECPRKFILSALANDLNTLSYHVWPHVAEAINAGDRSLVDYFYVNEYVNGKETKANLVSWWDQNKARFELPACQGYTAVKEKLQKGDNAFSETQKSVMSKYSALAEQYFSNLKGKPNYWYWRLDESYGYDDEEASKKLRDAYLSQQK